MTTATQNEKVLRLTTLVSLCFRTSFSHSNSRLEPNYPKPTAPGIPPRTPGRTVVREAYPRSFPSPLERLPIRIRWGPTSRGGGKTRSHVKAGDPNAAWHEHRSQRGTTTSLSPHFHSTVLLDPRKNDALPPMPPLVPQVHQLGDGVASRASATNVYDSLSLRAQSPMRPCFCNRAIRA
jgi:hypothetical protein